MKPNVFLIHGWNMPPIVMTPLVKALETRFSVTLAKMSGYDNPEIASVALDRSASTPGYRSAMPADGSSDPAIEHHPTDAESLDAIVAAVCSQAPPNAHWIGWSLGATVAMAASIQFSAFVESMTLISPTPSFCKRTDWEWGFDKSVFEKLLRLTLKRYETGTKTFLKLQCPTMAPKTLAEILDQLKQNRPTDDGLQMGFECLTETDLRSQLSQILNPVQVIAATEDNIIPHADSRFAAYRMAFATFESIGLHHWLPLSHPVQVAAAIDRFCCELLKK